MSGFPQSQSYPPQYNSYGTAGTGGYATPPNVSQFDPVPQSQSWEQQNTSQQSFEPGYQNVSYQNQSHYSTGNYNPTQSSTIGSQGVEHPRDYIQKNKGYLEDRNEYHWKQVLNAFDALEEAWSKRAQQLQMEQQAYAQYGNNASQYDSYIRTAMSYRDATASCKLQMKEVKSGYHLSSDKASRDLVRKALNAGVKDLPGWP